MNARKRGYALLLCVGLILALFVSSAFLIHEADHDCSGEDCPICRTIALTTALMRTLCLAAAMWLFGADRRPVRLPCSGIRLPSYRGHAGQPENPDQRLTEP